MNFKITIESNLYEGEKFAAKIVDNKIIIGGKPKFSLEIEALLTLFKKDFKKKFYNNLIVRYEAPGTSYEFEEWLNAIQNKGKKIKFVNSLGRLMR